MGLIWEDVWWLVACGLWLVACGLWLVACGLWLVACGLWWCRIGRDVVKVKVNKGVGVSVGNVGVWCRICNSVV